MIFVIFGGSTTPPPVLFFSFSTPKMGAVDMGVSKTERRSKNTRRAKTNKKSSYKHSTGSWREISYCWSIPCASSKPKPWSMVGILPEKPCRLYQVHSLISCQSSRQDLAFHRRDAGIHPPKGNPCDTWMTNDGEDQFNSWNINSIFTIINLLFDSFLVNALVQLFQTMKITTGFQLLLGESTGACFSTCQTIFHQP